ncbi:hypothetical protein U4E84_04800 [Halorubrum sp. AD140]|uniref:DUF7344 domain-containing protein n=1 Tax=Halorubrum sp. AD140 TaxID=3050073 RepID=UPI002ACD0DF9|nr:hypothetical protein [Halorubrum sp. AD140]MDZ5810664.1 hypothetical protein [Halorubrum sp. AD140]
MSSTPTDFDSVLDLCQHQHRRIVLGVLAEEQRPVTLSDLTRAVLRYNHHTHPTEASEDVITKTRISLSHVHLPKLVEEGYVHYDTERQLVEPIEQSAQVQQTLSTILAADSSLDMPVDR